MSYRLTVESGDVDVQIEGESSAIMHLAWLACEGSQADVQVVYPKGDRYRWMYDADIQKIKRSVTYFEE